MDFDFSAEDIALQEPLIPFTLPPRNDPGWSILETKNAVLSSSVSAVEDGEDEPVDSEDTALLTGDADSLALVKAEKGQVTSHRNEQPDETIRRLYDIARQPVSWLLLHQAPGSNGDFSLSYGL